MKIARSKSFLDDIHNVATQPYTACFSIMHSSNNYLICKNALNTMKYKQNQYLRSSRLCRSNRYNPLDTVGQYCFYNPAWRSTTAQDIDELNNLLLQPSTDSNKLWKTFSHFFLSKENNSQCTNQYKLIQKNNFDSNVARGHPITIEFEKQEIPSRVIVQRVNTKDQYNKNKDNLTKNQTEICFSNKKSINSNSLPPSDDHLLYPNKQNIFLENYFSVSPIVTPTVSNVASPITSHKTLSFKQSNVIIKNSAPNILTKEHCISNRSIPLINGHLYCCSAETHHLINEDNLKSNISSFLIKTTVSSPVIKDWDTDNKLALSTKSPLNFSQISILEPDLYKTDLIVPASLSRHYQHIYCCYICNSYHCKCSTNTFVSNDYYRSLPYNHTSNVSPDDSKSLYEDSYTGDDDINNTENDHQLLCPSILNQNNHLQIANSQRITFEFSAGLCVLKPRRQTSNKMYKQFEVLVIKRVDDAFYEIPKGHLESGETLQKAAERELREETGLLNKVIILHPILSEIYTVTTLQHHHPIEKTVHYFSARLKHASYNKSNIFTKTLKRQQPAALFGDKESQTCEIRWVTLEEAKTMYWKSNTVSYVVAEALRREELQK